jgi:hypothetical protein
MTDKNNFSAWSPSKDEEWISVECYKEGRIYGPSTLMRFLTAWQ